MSSISITEMRKAIAKEYPDSMSWLARVYKMPTYQVVAIFKKFQSDGRFDKKKKTNSQPVEFRQMTIFDYI